MTTSTYKKNTTAQKKAGFTLVEMLVAIFVFSVVMTLATGAIFSIVSANKTSQALKSVLDNLNSSLDSMSRDMRYGTFYHCGGFPAGLDAEQLESCPAGETSFVFAPKNTNPSNMSQRVMYRFDQSANGGAGAIQKCQGSINNCESITAPEVHITDMHFYVTGAGVGEPVQPRVTITLSGYAQGGVNQSAFSIETMVTERNPVCKQVMIDQGICFN